MNIIGTHHQNQAVDASQLKEMVIDRIYTIDDLDYLKALKKILDTGRPAGDNIYYTNDKQKAAIRQGKDQILKGQYITNEELETDEDRWLNE